MSGPTQVKPVLFKGQVYVEDLEESCNTFEIVVGVEEEREKWTGVLFKETMVETFSRTDKRHQCTDSKIQQILIRINIKTCRHNITKLLKTKDKEKTEESLRGEKKTSL